MNRSLVNFLCAFIPNKEKRHSFRKKYLKNHIVVDKQYKDYASDFISTNEIRFALLNVKDKIKNINNIKIENKNKFLLFKYTYKPYVSWSDTKYVNLGDYVQTVATKNALDTIFKNNQYEYFDRDNLTNYYGGNIITVMQGWFSHGYNFIPNDKILPVFVGTHFIKEIHGFLKQFLIYNGEYFKDKEIGCRDLHTLEFCKKNNIKAYFSRCLTLTLPKRKTTDKQTKVFITNVPDKFLEYIPDKIKNRAEYIKQRNVGEGRDDFESNWIGYYSDTEKLLNRYRDEAKLVITTALHCAGPCLAMGIPVILLTNCEEQKTRFSALDGLIKINTIDDLKNNLIDYDNIKAPDIEELKKYILKNLELSIKKALHEEVDEIELQKIRDNIKNFRVVENTWKEEFEYTQSMENRIKQMLNLIDFNYNSVMDLGCGKQTLKKYIKDGTKYYPINQYNQAEGTIIKDFNKGEFLNQKVDICFASGILEYMYNIDQFIENISKNCDYFLGSYIFKEDMPERNPIWVNNFSKEELYKIIEKYGFELVKDCVCEDKYNSIYLFKKVR